MDVEDFTSKYIGSHIKKIISQQLQIPIEDIGNDFKLHESKDNMYKILQQLEKDFSVYMDNFSAYINSHEKNKDVNCLTEDVIENIRHYYNS